MSIGPSCRLRLAAGIAIFAALGAPVARAEPLAKEACETLKGEHDKLEAAGMQDKLKKGAAWGKTNLTPAEIKDIARYIGLEEQLLFRCGFIRLKQLPNQEGEDGETTSTGKSSDTLKPTVSDPPSEAPPVPRRKPAHAVKAQPSASEPEVKKALPKPKPKPKIDDAYRPPRPSGQQTDGTLTP